MELKQQVEELQKCQDDPNRQAKVAALLAHVAELRAEFTSQSLEQSAAGPMALIDERGRAVSKYTMLANAGGLTLCLSQTSIFAVQLLLGHTKIESTVRYLGIEVDDALAIAEQVDV
jgi:hypothetical protein